jgi:hypothetical protein
MGTPTPGMPGEPFAEAAGEAVQTAVMAVRLMTAITDAVRRHQQRKNKGEEDALPPAEDAVAEMGEALKKLFPPDISTALMAGADWPLMAQQLLALQRAGVDMADYLPRVGEVAVMVRDSVAAKNTDEGVEGEWVSVLRETLPAGPVREAILSSPRWPDMAATMERLKEHGVDVGHVLRAAATEGALVDRTVGEKLGAGSTPVTSRDSMLSYGPLTTGLDLPKNLDLGDRARALRQLAISPTENERYTRWVREAMPERGREADLMVNSRQWPLVAARMAKMEGDGKPVREHLAQLMKDTSWEEGPAPQLGSRLVQAANDALRRPFGEAVSRVKVNTAAARATSTTVGPTRPRATEGAASAEAGVAPHRRESAPVPKSGKAR